MSNITTKTKLRVWAIAVVAFTVFGYVAPRASDVSATNQVQAEHGVTLERCDHVGGEYDDGDCWDIDH